MSKKRPVGEISEDTASHVVKIKLTSQQLQQLRVVAVFAGVSAAAFAKDKTLVAIEEFLRENKQLADKLKAI